MLVRYVFFRGDNYCMAGEQKLLQTCRLCHLLEYRVG